MENTKFAVLIPTYQRTDNRTPEYLRRALKSVFDQTYQDFKIFVIGDKYEDDFEFESIIKEFDTSKIIYVNLYYAKERDKYSDNLQVLWSYGGVNASNYAIDLALIHGYEYMCRLDQDDYWSSIHLENFNKVLKLTKADFLCSKSTYLNSSILPSIITDEFYVDFIPNACQLINSSTCINFRKIPNRYRDLYEETGALSYPSDAQLWMDIRNFLQQNNLKSKMVNEVTCYHNEEGSIK